jgi:ketosteroid isomerase-like protein
MSSKVMTIRKDFKSLTNRYYAAWSKIDENWSIETPAQMYAKDTACIFFDVLPPLEGYQGWEAFRENMEQSVYKNMVSLLTGNDDVQVTHHGDIAWTTQTFHGISKSQDGKVEEFDGRSTLIWVKQDDEWLIVHEHASIPFNL